MGSKLFRNWSEEIVVNEDGFNESEPLDLQLSSIVDVKMTVFEAINFVNYLNQMNGYLTCYHSIVDENRLKNLAGTFEKLVIRDSPVFYRNVLVADLNQGDVKDFLKKYNSVEDIGALGTLMFVFNDWDAVLILRKMDGLYEPFFSLGKINTQIYKEYFKAGY